MKRPCLTCGALTNGSRCPAHTLRNGSTRSWRETRAATLVRDAFRCELCGGPADEVDHIIPVVDGGGDHPSNTRALCRRCHAARHAGR